LQSTGQRKAKGEQQQQNNEMQKGAFGALLLDGKWLLLAS